MNWFKKREGGEKRGKLMRMKRRRKKERGDRREER